MTASLQSAKLFLFKLLRTTTRCLPSTNPMRQSNAKFSLSIHGATIGLVASTPITPRTRCWPTILGTHLQPVMLWARLWTTVLLKFKIIRPRSLNGKWEVQIGRQDRGHSSRFPSESTARRIRSPIAASCPLQLIMAAQVTSRGSSRPDCIPTQFSRPLGRSLPQGPELLHAVLYCHYIIDDQTEADGIDRMRSVD